MYKNVLEVAHIGLRDPSGDLLTTGDGTAYVTGSSATVDVANRQFDLTTPTFIADLTEADNIVNSFILWFTATGNEYHITDYTASTDIVTVFETPDTNDTGAWEIRRVLDENDSSVANPPHYLQNNEPFRQWKGQAATAQNIYIMMPNYVLDGGFEEQAAGNVGGDWGAQTTDWQISSTSPLLGSRMAVFTDNAVDSYIQQDNLPGRFEKDKMYRIQMKIQSVTANPSAGALEIKIWQRRSPNNIIDTSSFIWSPTITTTATWTALDFTPEFTTDTTQLLITAITANMGSATAIRIDEIYIFERLSVQRFLVHNHNWNGSENILWRGSNCHPDRTSYSSNDYTELAAAFDQDGSELINKSHAGAVFAVHHIQIPAESNKTHEAGTIGIYEELELRDFRPSLGRGYSVGNVSFRTPKGISHSVHRQALKQNWTGSIRTTTTAEKVGVGDWWAWIVGGNKPFFWEDYAGIVKLVQITKILSIRHVNSLIEDISFAFEEVDIFEG